MPNVGSIGFREDLAGHGSTLTPLTSIPLTRVGIKIKVHATFMPLTSLSSCACMFKGDIRIYMIYAIRTYLSGAGHIIEKSQNSLPRRTQQCAVYVIVIPWFQLPVRGGNPSEYRWTTWVIPSSMWCMCGVCECVCVCGGGGYRPYSSFLMFAPFSNNDQETF